MKTRTLLILAVTCGLAILVAAALFFLQLSNQDEPNPALEIGDSAQLGDAIVTVNDYEVTDDAIVVTVTLSGVDDPDGVNGFTLIAPGKAISADAPSEVTGSTGLIDLPSCAGFTIEPQTCVLRFAAAGLEGSDRQLFFQRAAEQVRWRLA